MMFKSPIKNLIFHIVIINTNLLISLLSTRSLKSIVISIREKNKNKVRWILSTLVNSMSFHQRYQNLTISKTMIVFPKHIMARKLTSRKSIFRATKASPGDQWPTIKTQRLKFKGAKRILYPSLSSTFTKLKMMTV